MRTSMRYLIYVQSGAYYTDWFTLENNWDESMIAFDLVKNLYCIDGRNWLEIEEDHL